MARDERFTFLCNEKERRLIGAVAKRLNRTQSDAMRVLLKGAADELGVTADTANDGEGGGNDSS